jgi:hypothetical protein
VTHLDEVELVLGPVGRAQEGVDPVAGMAIDPLDAPLPETLEHVVGDELRHSDSFPRSEKIGFRRGRRAKPRSGAGGYD